MSETRANRGKGIRSAARVLLIVGGALGLFKTLLEYINKAIENRDLILAVCYYIGEAIFTFGFVYLIVVLLTSWIIESNLLNKFVKRKYGKDIHDTKAFPAFFIVVALPAAFVTYRGFLDDLRIRPEHYNSLSSILSISAGAAVIFALCVLMYLWISALSSEGSAKAGGNE
jgi:hypothetical protein